MEDKKNCLCEALEQLPSGQLDEMLQQELQKQEPESEVVLEIIRILEQREADQPLLITKQVSDAWNTYRQKATLPRKTSRMRGWLISAAAVAAVVLLAAAVPKTVDADGVFEAIARMTDSVLQFFDPDRDPGNLQDDFVFETEDPNLQKLYDTVTELGITEPVVPMWIPEGCQLTEWQVEHLPERIKVHALFKNGDRYISLTYKISPEITATQYEKLKGKMDVHEASGIGHGIVLNEGSYSAAWARDGVDCFITTSMEEQILYQVIDSIYRRNMR